MAVGDYSLNPFTLPVGDDSVAWQARSNDNLLRAKFVAHQADEVAHVQSGLASAKPASGTATGEVYIATDTGQMWIWSGAAWVSYGINADPSGYTYIVKSSTQDVTNAGLTNDTELTFAVTANNRYMLTMDLVIAGNNTTGDFTMDFNLSTGTMKGRGNVQNLTAAEAIQNVIITAAGTANTTAIVTGTPADLDTLIAIRIQYAFLYTSGSNGTLTFRFGNAAAAAGRTSRVYKGSILGYKNIT